MTQIINIAYIVNDDNKALLEASIASLKANAQNCEINIQCYENKNLFEVIAESTESRLMIVSPYCFFAADVVDLYNSMDDNTAIAGTIHPLKSIGEFKKYVNQGLKLDNSSFVTEQLLIVNPELVRRDAAFKKYLQLTDEEKNIYANPAEDYLNVCMSGKIKTLNNVLAAPGQHVDAPVAVTYAFTGKPWEHKTSEYSELYYAYESLVTKRIQSMEIRAIAEAYKNHTTISYSENLVVAM